MYEKNLKELQMIEQNLQQYQAQRQQFQNQITEAESALAEISGSQESYKIIGNIMVRTDAEKLRLELEEKKEMFEVRVKSLTKQEEKLRAKSKELQSQVLEGMKDDRADKKSN